MPKAENWNELCNLKPKPNIQTFRLYKNTDMTQEEIIPAKLILKNLHELKILGYICLPHFCTGNLSFYKK